MTKRSRRSEGFREVPLDTVDLVGQSRALLRRVHSARMREALGEAARGRRGDIHRVPLIRESNRRVDDEPLRAAKAQIRMQEQYPHCATSVAGANMATGEVFF